MLLGKAKKIVGTRKYYQINDKPLMKMLTPLLEPWQLTCSVKARVIRKDNDICYANGWWFDNFDYKPIWIKKQWNRTNVFERHIRFPRYVNGIYFGDKPILSLWFEVVHTSPYVFIMFSDDTRYAETYKILLINKETGLTKWLSNWEDVKYLCYCIGRQKVGDTKLIDLNNLCTEQFKDKFGMPAKDN